MSTHFLNPAASTSVPHRARKPVERQAGKGEREPQLYFIDDVANSVFSNEYSFTSRNVPRTFTS